MRHRPERPRRAGYTLVELLVVTLIILLLSAVALPAILPAINGRRIDSGAQILYGELTRIHDEAVRANSPRGFRLVPDPYDSTRPNVLTASRLIGIEPGPDYIEGRVSAYFMTPPYVTPAPPQFYPPPSALPQYNPIGTIPFPSTDDGSLYPYLVIHEDKWQNYFDPMGNLLATVPKSPTMWFYNLRQGDKFKLNDSPNVYTVAGPVTHPGITYKPFGTIADPNVGGYVNPNPNPDRLINFGPGYFSNPSGADSDGDGYPDFEFLYLVNGRDDDGDGYTDEGFDGLDNDNDGIIDPGFNGIDDNGDGSIDEAAELYLHRNADGSFVYPGIPFTGYDNGGFPFGTPGPLPNEFEQESFVVQGTVAPGSAYTIARRPVLSTRSRAIDLPTNVVVDLTTWNSPSFFGTSSERSRLPVDPYSGIVDILVYPDGRVTTMSANANVTTSLDLPFYHFWLAEVEDVYEPLAIDSNQANIGQVNHLPMARAAIPDVPFPLPSGPSKRNVIYPTTWPTLEADRRLISVNTQTGQILINRVEEFDPTNVELPYRAAQTGTKEE